MKLSCLLLICLTSIVLRANAYVHFSGDNVIPTLLIAGLLVFWLVSLRNRSPVPAVTTVTPQARCNDGYTLYPGPGKSFCFRFSADCRSWDEAQTACQTEGGNLIVLDDESIEPFVRGLKPNLLTVSNCGEPIAYLGAKIDAEAVAKYTDGRIISYEIPIWLPGLPFRPNSCVAAGLNRDRDNNVFLLRGDCNEPLRYVCQKI